MSNRSVRLSPLNRWWIYQKERFPIYRNGLLVAIFSTSAVGYSVLLRSVQQGLLATELRPIPQLCGLMLLAFLGLFLSFLQLQIASEFKYLPRHVLYRPYHPVTRGLVSLLDLQIVELACGLIQFGLALTLGLPMLMLMLGLWICFGLIQRDFFVPQWLKAHGLFYLFSQAAIMPLLALYATAHDWLAIGGITPRLGWFLLSSFFSGLAMQLGQKIRAPKDEEPGIETYSALWGYRQSVLVWLIAVWLTAMVTLQAAIQINFAVPVTVAVLMLLVGSVLTAWQFWKNPTAKLAQRIELISGLWLLSIYFNVGILPLLLQLSQV